MTCNDNKARLAPHDHGTGDCLRMILSWVRSAGWSLRVSRLENCGFMSDSEGAVWTPALVSV